MRLRSCRDTDARWYLQNTQPHSNAGCLADLDKWDESVKPDSARIAGTCDYVESPAASESSDESADYSDYSSSDE